MTIEQILSNSSKGGELTKKLLYNSLKLKIESTFSNVVKNYCENISNTIANIASGDASRLGYYNCCVKCSSDSSYDGKVIVSDEMKEELLSVYKDIVKKEIENYRNNMKILLGLKEEKTEEKPKEVEITATIEKPVVAPANNYFSY